MSAKVIVLLALVSICLAVPVYHEEHGHENEHHAPAEYKFSYSVHDKHTGDIKSQEEERHGDKVRGSYSLVEPDGHKRTVHYTSDKHTGFLAEVHREGTSHHVPVAHHETHHSTPVREAHHAAPSHGHVATSHASISIAHHEDHHGDYHHGGYHH